jgi:predicted secreted protein
MGRILIVTSILLMVCLIAGCNGNAIETMTTEGTTTTETMTTEETITIKVNQEFVIALRDIPGLGTNWYEAYDGNMLALVEKTYIPDDETNPRVGGTRNFQFKALKIGITTITFTHSHSGMTQILDEKVFTIDIE